MQQQKFEKQKAEISVSRERRVKRGESKLASFDLRDSVERMRPPTSCQPSKSSNVIVFSALLSVFALRSPLSALPSCFRNFCFCTGQCFSFFHDVRSSSSRTTAALASSP